MANPKPHRSSNHNPPEWDLKRPLAALRGPVDQAHPWLAA